MELWDLYDRERIPLQKTIARGGRLMPGEYRNVVHICLIDSNDRMLIQRRAADKSSWADLWDFSVGGHIISGETSSQGAQRELMEELGISIDFSDIRPSFTINFETGFDDYYILRLDTDPGSLVIQEEEVQSVRYAERTEILSMLDNGSFIPYRRSLIYLIFEMCGTMGAHNPDKK